MPEKARRRPPTPRERRWGRGEVRHGRMNNGLLKRVSAASRQVRSTAVLPVTRERRSHCSGCTETVQRSPTLLPLLRTDSDVRPTVIAVAPRECDV